MAGLSDTGFTPKTSSEIKSELRIELSDSYANIGETINTDPSSRFGQNINVFSKQLSEAWDAMQDIYNSYFPLTSTKSSLDNANSLTDTTRLKARSSAAVVLLIGDGGTVVEQGSKIAVVDSTEDFMLSNKNPAGPDDLSDYVIADESTLSALVLDGVAESGTIKIGYDGNYYTAQWNDNAAAIKSGLEGLSGVTTVDVKGDFTGTELGMIDPNFVFIELISSSLASKELLIDANLLLDSNDDPLEVLSKYAIQANTLSVKSGPIRALAGTLIHPKTVISGWDFSYNPNKAVEGRLVEEDGNYRLRRYEELARKGTATAGGIREAVIEAINSDIYNVSLVQNDKDTEVDGALFPNKMPPKSFEIFVNATDDDSTNDAIAQSIYDAKSLGIEAVSTDGGSRSGEYTDVNGKPGLIIPFSSTVDVPIFVTVQRTKTPDYPDDGDEQIKNNLIAYFNQFEIGRIVLHHGLFTPVNLVIGMSKVVILIGTSASPTLEDNIPITAYQTATTVIGNLKVEDYIP